MLLSSLCVYGGGTCKIRALQKEELGKESYEEGGEVE